jgi:hypothetical protein
MTYEVGIRFLTDYLQGGDAYFKIKRPGHNHNLNHNLNLNLNLAAPATSSDLWRVLN